MTPIRTALSEKMHVLADGGHARASELREKADAFDAATAKAGQPGAAKSILGAWARARRVWCECTGDPLV